MHRAKSFQDSSDLVFIHLRFNGEKGKPVAFANNGKHRSEFISAVKDELALHNWDGYPAECNQMVLEALETWYREGSLRSGDKICWDSHKAHSSNMTSEWLSDHDVESSPVPSDIHHLVIPLDNSLNGQLRRMWWERFDYLEPRTSETKWTSFCDIFAEISPRTIRGYIKHCGYTSNDIEAVVTRLVLEGKFGYTCAYRDRVVELSRCIDVYWRDEYERRIQSEEIDISQDMHGFYYTEPPPYLPILEPRQN